MSLIKFPTPGSLDPTRTLYHHSLITSEFDALAFGAAAALQLQYAVPTSQIATIAHESILEPDYRLIASPYNLPDNLLDLSKYDHHVQNFAKALTLFKPVRDDYATAEYCDSFNLSTIFAFLSELNRASGLVWKRRQFYVVTFRSRLTPNADSDRLFDLDRHSHREAMESGGLIKYWYGAKDEERRNLATCKLLSADMQYLS